MNQAINKYLAELMGYEVVFIPEEQDCVHIICETGTRVAFNISTSASDLNAVIDKFGVAVIPKGNEFIASIPHEVEVIYHHKSGKHSIDLSLGKNKVGRDKDKREAIALALGFKE